MTIETTESSEQYEFSGRFPSQIRWVKTGGSLCENIEWSLNADVLQWRWLGGVGEPATCAQQNLQNKDFYIRTAGVGFSII